MSTLAYWWGTKGRGWLYPTRDAARYYKTYRTRDTAEAALQLAVRSPPPSPQELGGAVLARRPWLQEPFTLQNDPPPYRPWRGEEPEPLKQKMLLEGLHCCQGQQDLFDGQSPEEE